MKFIELDRCFAPLKIDQEATLDWGLGWGRKYGGWLDWDELLKRRRVALLAEALSGKTEELRHRVNKLNEAGKNAYFVRIEDLADESFEAALDAAAVESFEAWKAAIHTEAWFFLDSVDEARLNGKSFDTALRKFSKNLGLANLGRSYIFVTCRVSDWKGKADRDSFCQLLPYYAASPPQTPTLNQDEELLAPIFNRSEKTRQHSIAPPEPIPSGLLVVQLTPLSIEQQKRLAVAAGVSNIDAFTEAVEHSGLGAMTERPGDMLDLVSYWKENDGFGSLCEMTELSVVQKLREEDAFRADAPLLPPEKAYQGAERLAAALTLGKTFTLKSLGQEPDPFLAAGAVEPRDVLVDWNGGEQTALLRRGIFTPATYGRIRFHHRSTQEYLTATWLDRMLSSNCPLEEVWQFLFQECYGVKTVTPSLRPVAAWLSIRQPTIRDEVIRREPVTLIQHGDPKSLPLESRRALLLAYAALDAEGQLNPQMLDNRAIWMFADKELASAIRQAWCANPRPHFRMELMRFIQEAEIEECADLARNTALDRTQDQYSRIVAAQTIAACNDVDGLKQLAAQVKAAPDRLSASLAPELALVLYPNYLTTDDLLDLIDRSESARPFQSEGFARHLEVLHQAAPDRVTQKQLAFALAELCLAPPHTPEGTAISSRHSELAKGLPDVARAELKAHSIGNVEPGLVRLLMAIERVSDMHNDEGGLEFIRGRVKEDKVLKRDLFWAVVQSGKVGESRINPPTRVWQIGSFCEHRLWEHDITDMEWLLNDSKSQTEISDRQVALSAIISVLHSAGRSAEVCLLLERVVSDNDVLTADLREYLTPVVQTPAELKRVADNLARKLKREQEQELAKQSWRDFKISLEQNPAILDDLSKAGLWKLHDLTRWLRAKIGSESHETARNWRLLEISFGTEVAHHYCLAMKQAWRQIKPERPVCQGVGHYTTKYLSLLAIDSLYVDSAEDTDWERKLTKSEVEIAVRHACFLGYCGSDWFERLVKVQPDSVLPVVTSSVGIEFHSDGTRYELLAQCAFNESSIHSIVARKVFGLLRKMEPSDDITLDRCLRILVKTDESVIEPKALKRLIEKRIDLHLGVANEKRAIRYFSLYIKLNPDEAVERLESILERYPTETEVDWFKRSERWFGSLFSRFTGGASAGRIQMSVAAQKSLVRLAYKHIPPQMEIEPEEDRSGTGRDAAKNARQEILNRFIACRGADAHSALLDLASDPMFRDSALRFKELAHGKAEDDSEIQSWKPSEVVTFEKTHVGVVKTGADLLRVVLAVLSDIAASFDHADASSQSVLALAEDEVQVQNWLAERLRECSKGRYHVHREVEVAEKNEPDIIISSTSANVEVAIEIKHANKGWSVPQLENALKSQLANDYLRTKNRRHGILFVSQHKQRTWRPSGHIWQFDDLLAHLSELATSVVKNSTGKVDVKVFGLNVVVKEK